MVIDNAGVFKHSITKASLHFPRSNHRNQCRAITGDMQHQQTQAPLFTGGDRQDQGHKWILSKQYFGIGKSKHCGLRVGGWFTLKLIAKIIRQSDGYYLIPEKWGKVRLNGTPLSGRVKLQNWINCKYAI